MTAKHRLQLCADADQKDGTAADVKEVVVKTDVRCLKDVAPDGCDTLLEWCGLFSDLVQREPVTGLGSAARSTLPLWVRGIDGTCI